MMMACVLVLSLRCINVYEHGCELGCVEVVDAVYSAFFLVSLCKELGKQGLKLAWVMFLLKRSTSCWLRFIENITSLKNGW